MIPKKPAPDLIRGGNRFSEKHALGLDPGDHAQTKKLEPGSDAIRTDKALGPTYLDGRVALGGLEDGVDQVMHLERLLA